MADTDAEKKAALATEELDATDAPSAEVRAELAKHSRERHPGQKEYVRIAVILCLITAAEVAVYYMHSLRSVLIPLLLAFAAVKFSLVVLFFMHLRFDDRFYARVFVTGLLFAGTVYIIVLLTFRAFAG